MNWKSEAETAIIVGVSRQTLRNWRLGVTVKGRTYPPRVKKDVDWVKMGAGVFFTEVFFIKLKAGEI